MFLVGAMLQTEWSLIWILLASLTLATLSPAADDLAWPGYDGLASTIYHPPQRPAQVARSRDWPPDDYDWDTSGEDHFGEEPRVFSVFYGYDSWRGIPDGAWTNNGLHVGLNAGLPLGQFGQRTGIGAQIGGSVGVYDLGGTDYRLNNQDQATTQGFVTLGFFRRADEGTRWSVGFAQDWMLNNNYSVMGEDSTLYQWRGQLGYANSDLNEFGVWGAWRGQGDTRQVRFFGPVTWQPINQISFFWHHKWGYGGADTWISIGVPERDRLAGDGSLGDYVVGAWSAVPIAERLALYSMVNYMHQSGRPGPAAAKEEAWNFYLGVAFYPRGLARSASVRGHRWSPLLPVANNGLFLVDASRTY